jgi:hypothetical protein
VNHFVVALLVFACVCGSMLFGVYLRLVLPEHQFGDEAKDVAKLAIGLIATMAALVLGLLLSSARGSFDALNTELVRSSATAVRLDRVLARYGPETQSIRTVLKTNYAQSVDIIASGDASRLAMLSSPEGIGKGEDLQRQVEDLAPQTAAQRQLKARALQLVDEAFSARWLALLQGRGSLPVPLLVLLVSWLSIIFGTLGLYAPRTITTMATLVMCVMSTSGAIFLIMEMKVPLGGVVRISLEPMYAALAILGR